MAMGIKSFLMKKAFQAKGMSKEQAEHLTEEMNKNPQLLDSLKQLEQNKELKELFEKIQKEMDEKKKTGMNDMYAAVQVMGKYKAEIAKYREELAPLLQLMQK